MKSMTFILAGLLLAAGSGFSGTILVPGDYSSLQAAINVSADGDTVLVAEGTYTGDGNTGVTFHGKVITVRSENGPETTIIDCEFDGRGFDFFNGEGEDSRLEGFTIRNGNNGGVYCWYSSPLIADCLILDNDADSTAGGITCYSSSPILSSCTIAGNTASTSGGGIECSLYSFPVIDNCIISGNTTRESGGGLACDEQSSPILSSCTIAGNTASTSGGGIYGANSHPYYPVVTNCILWENTPDEIDAPAGEVEVTYSDVMGGWPGEGNLDADPLFADLENQDYHLSLDSPCIDSGTESDEALDLDDQPRPYPRSGDFDMGVDERWPQLEVSVELSDDFLDRGEDFTIGYNVYNPEKWIVPFEGWIDITLPNGEPLDSNPYIGPASINLWSHQSFSGDIDATVKNKALFGTYEFTLEIAEEYGGLSFGSGCDTLNVVP